MYSVDFRKKALALLEDGRSIRQVALDLNISPTTIQHWKKDINPKLENKGRLPKVTLDDLRKDVEMYPDAYQHERATRFNCKQSSICARLKKLKVSKKNSPTP